jgi:hypothetical protein
MNPSRPLTVTITQVLIMLNILFWLAFGILVATNRHPGIPDLPGYKNLLAVLAFAAAGVLMVSSIFLPRHSRKAYTLVVAFFVAASIAIFFDQVGWTDLAVLLLNLTALILLLKDRSWYLEQLNGSVGKP